MEKAKMRQKIWEKGYIHSQVFFFSVFASFQINYAHAMSQAACVLGIYERLSWHSVACSYIHTHTHTARPLDANRLNFMWHEIGQTWNELLCKAATCMSLFPQCNSRASFSTVAAVSFRLPLLWMRNSIDDGYTQTTCQCYSNKFSPSETLCATFVFRPSWPVWI